MSYLEVRPRLAGCCDKEIARALDVNVSQQCCSVVNRWDFSPVLSF